MDKSITLNGFKSRLVSYLGQVREGESLLIVDRDRPLARLVPASSNPVEQRLYTLARNGQLFWDGGKPFGLPDGEAPEMARVRVEVELDAES